MPEFKVRKIEHRSIVRWYTVRAEDEDEAIEAVRQGDVPEDSVEDGEGALDEFSVVER